ncbi:hypothetical protein [Alkalibaculum bacchi]|nr:hypothetical protein [Alkalibaculum bacchi]
MEAKEELGALSEEVSGVWESVCIECKRLELERSSPACESIKR